MELVYPNITVVNNRSKRVRWKEKGVRVPMAARKRKLLSSGIDSKQNAAYIAYEVSSAIYFLRQQKKWELEFLL